MEDDNATKNDVVEFEKIKNELQQAIAKSLQQDNLHPHDFILLDGFFNQPFQNELSTKIVLGGKTVPMVAVIKQATGQLLFYALKALLPNLKI
jgi:hypothetical protein